LFAISTFVLKTHIIGVLKTRRMRWEEHVACMGERQGVYMILISRLEGKTHLESLGVGGKIILKGSARRGMGREPF
jgi:hypothetical protein